MVVCECLPHLPNPTQPFSPTRELGIETAGRDKVAFLWEGELLVDRRNVCVALRDCILSEAIELRRRLCASTLPHVNDQETPPLGS